MYNTKEEVAKVHQEMTDVEKELRAQMEVVLKTVDVMKSEFETALQECRKEMSRLNFEIERMHKIDKRKRTIANKYLKK
jgi:BMFP domain-containing protein YqiC